MLLSHWTAFLSFYILLAEVCIAPFIFLITLAICKKIKKFSQQSGLILGAIAYVLSSVLFLFLIMNADWGDRLPYIPYFFLHHIYYPFFPIFIGLSVWFICLNIGILMHEFRCFMNKTLQPPSLIATLFAIFFLGFFVNKSYAWWQNYCVISNCHLSQATLEKDKDELNNIYHQAIQSDDPRASAVLLGLASNQNASPELIETVYKKASDLDDETQKEIYLRLASNPKTPSTLLKILAEKNLRSTILLNELTYNPNLTQDIMKIIIKSDNCEVRREIIFHKNVSVGILQDIINRDPDLSLQEDAKKKMENRSPEHIMNASEYALSDADYRAFLRLQQRTKKSDSVVELQRIYNIINTRPNFVALLPDLASNSHLTVDLIRQIYAKSQTTDAFFRAHVMQNLAINPNTPADILNQMIMQSDLTLIEKISTNENLPSELVLRLAGFPDCKIRKNIIKNPKTDVAVVKQLNNDMDESVRNAASVKLSGTQQIRFDFY